MGTIYLINVKLNGINKTVNVIEYSSLKLHQAGGDVRAEGMNCLST